MGGMNYELTDKLCDDITVNNAIMENMEDIGKLQNTIEMHQKLISTLSNRVDILTILVNEGFMNNRKVINIESRV